MKKVRYLALILLLSGFNIFSTAQDAKVITTGSWTGAIQGLKVVFNIELVDSSFQVTMDSPDQGAYGIKVDEFSLVPSDVRFTIKMVGGIYNGSLNNQTGQIEGTWYQQGMEFPLNLAIGNEPGVLIRPQEPKAPFPYKEEEVLFVNKKDNVGLAGTLSIPEGEGEFPAIILISGSGPQDRNETILGHKPFLVLADFFTRNGFAVLRYDDRGYGKSTGDLLTGTTMDFASDAKAGIKFLKSHTRINPDHINVIGHSEGAMIAAIIASGNDDINSIVMLAGSGLSGKETLFLQARMLMEEAGETQDYIDKTMKANDKIYNILSTTTDDEKARQKIEKEFSKYMKGFSEEEQQQRGMNSYMVEAQIKELLKPWMRFFLNFDIKPYLGEVKCPVLVLNGTNDLQVPYQFHVPPIKEALEDGGNTDVTVHILPGLNHLFQTSKTGAPTEYASIEETFSQKAMDLMLEFLRKE